jgi:hypothetical protein
MVAEVLNVSRCMDVCLLYICCSIVTAPAVCLSVCLCILTIYFDILRSYRSNEALLNDVSSGVICIVYVANYPTYFFWRYFSI